MHMKRCRLLVLAMCLAAPAAAQSDAVPAGVDHVPIAVRSLAEAESSYVDLGFRLKPGRPHDNGLRNAFAKFPDGTYLELITPAQGAVDALTGRYAAFLQRGEGGAFLAFRAASLDALAGRMRAARWEPNLTRYGDAFTTLGFPESALDWIFFIQYNWPVTDRPEFLDHPNTALGIETVWVTDSAYATLEVLDQALWKRQVRLDLTREHPRITGITLRVRSLDAARAFIRERMAWDLRVNTDARGRSVIISPLEAHGVWIELLERSN